MRLLAILALSLSLSAKEIRTYWPVSISVLANGKNKHTHVQITGKVTLAKHEADGDFHIRISDGHFFIVAECIPELSCTHPKKGDMVTVKGIARFDGEHKWSECHPVEDLQIQ